jgi:hypothetical protein
MDIKCKNTGCGNIVIIKQGVINANYKDTHHKYEEIMQHFD